MGKKTNWGAGLRALGSGLQGLAMMQREERMREEEIAREAELYNDRYRQTLADRNAFRKEGWAHDIEMETMKRLYADEPEQQYVPPVQLQQPIGPGMSGGAMPMTSGSPVGDVIAGMQRWGNVTPETAMKIEQQMGLKAYGQGQGGAPKAGPRMGEFTVDPSLPGGGGTYEVREQDIPGHLLRQAGLLEEPNEKTMTPDQRRRAADNAGLLAFPLPDVTLGKYSGQDNRVVWNPGIADIRESRLLGRGFLAKYRAEVGAKAMMEKNKGKHWTELAREVIEEADIPEEERFLPENFRVEDGRLEERVGRSWTEVKVAEARDKLLGLAKKGSVQYEAMKEVLEGLGGEYNRIVPGVGETPNPEDQVDPFIPGQSEFR